jgi:hypothetical protein
VCRVCRLKHDMATARKVWRVRKLMARARQEG